MSIGSLGVGEHLRIRPGMPEFRNCSCRCGSGVTVLHRRERRNYTIVMRESVCVTRSPYSYH